MQYLPKLQPTSLDWIGLDLLSGMVLQPTSLIVDRMKTKYNPEIQAV